MRPSKACALALLFLAFGCREAAGPSAQYRPEKAGTVDHALCLLGFTAVPVREVGTGHHLIEATINGRTGQFVLDTGANMTVIDRAHLGQFGIDPDSGAIGGALRVGAAGEARRVGIDSFRIGDVPIRQGRVVTSDLGQLLTALSRVAGVTVNGIIGQDALSEHRAIIDVARPMLYVMEEDRDPAPVAAERCTAEEAEGGG